MATIILLHSRLSPLPTTKSDAGGASNVVVRDARDVPAGDSTSQEAPSGGGASGDGGGAGSGTEDGPATPQEVAGEALTAGFRKLLLQQQHNDAAGVVAAASSRGVSTTRHSR